MRAQSIYNMFCDSLPYMKSHVRKFTTHGNNAIVLFMKDFSRPLLFTVIDVNKGYWKLEQLINQ